MKLKQYLEHKFDYEDQQTINSAHIADLQKQILAKAKKRKQPVIKPKYIFLAATFAVVCILGVMQFFVHTPSDKKHIVQSVSAKEIIKKTQQTLKESTQVYYKVHYGGKRYEKAVSTGFQIVEPQQGTFEYWYDFKNNYVRVEEPDPLTQGKTKWVRIQKRISDNKYTLYWYTADPETKKGEFHEDNVSKEYIIYRPSGGLENGVNLPTNPRERLEEILKKFDKGNVKLETIKENGDDYYKLSVIQSYDTKNENLQVTQYILVIDKNTYEPYKEIKVYEEGKGVVETIYDDVSTDFDTNVFGPVPPKGYSVQ